MSKEIVIQATKNGARIAITEGGALVELYIETPENTRTIGDIYLGRVRNVMPSIQAGFVNIGQKQDAFLHFSDVGETLDHFLNFIGEEPVVSNLDVHVPRVHRSIRISGEYEKSPRDSDSKKNKSGSKDNGKSGGRGRKKGGKSDDAADYIHPARYLRNGARMLVQIVKEPISTKGSRVTSHVTLAGRFLVLVPFGDYVAVSKKVSSARERKRLQTLGKSLLPEGFGLIIRTVASGKDARTLHTDLSLLVQKWNRISSKLEGKPSPPQLLHKDVSMVSSIIRDLFTDDYDRILVDDQRLFKSVQTYVRAVAPTMLDAVQRHEGSKPVFEEVGIAASIAEAFSERVELPSGGYVIIEHTEAMHVIDVNSGRSGKGESQEDSSLKVNLEAASVLAHQLRLRDLGGIIVVDFIDLRDEKSRNKVVNRLKLEFRKDRAVTKVLPMSDFGLIQITRQRLRPSITTDETAREAELAAASERAVKQSRESRGQAVRPPAVELIFERLNKDLEDRSKAKEKSPLDVTVHPFFAAFLKKGFPNRLSRLWFKHRIRLHLTEDESLVPTEYVLRGSDSEIRPETKATAKSSGDEARRDDANGRSRGDGRLRDSRGRGGNRSKSGSRSGSRTNGQRDNRSRGQGNKPRGDQGDRNSGGGKSSGSNSRSGNRSGTRARGRSPGSGKGDDSNKDVKTKE